MSTNATAGAERPSPELLRLHQAGTTLANIAFNLAQRPGDPLLPEVAQGLDASRREWDAACAAFRARRKELAAQAAAVPALQSLKRLADILDKMGNMPDEQIDPMVWRRLECEAAMAESRHVLAAAAGDAKPATQGEKT